MGKKETILSLSNEEIQCRELLIHEVEDLRSQTKLGWSNPEISQQEALTFLMDRVPTGRQDIARTQELGHLVRGRTISDAAWQGLEPRIKYSTCKNSCWKRKCPYFPLFPHPL